MQEEVVLEGFRLSPQQRRLWFLQQADGSAPYRVQCAVLISGALRPETLAAAIREVIERHEILRTSFELLPEMTVPLQLINAAGTLNIEEHDLRGLARSEQEARIEDLLATVRQTPVDLHRGATVQTSLLTLVDDRHVLLLTVAALVGDQPSLRNLVSEISQSYDACMRGDAAAELPPQYVDLAEWQNELLESEDTAVGREYWRSNNLFGDLEVTLPFAKAPSSSPGFEPQVVTQVIAADTAIKISELARQYETTVAAVLMAGWQTLIALVTGQREITLGLACDGRKYDELKAAVGPLTKYLPVQSRVVATARFREIAAQAHAAAGEVYRWQESFSWEQLGTPDKSDSASVFFPLGYMFVADGPDYAAADVIFAIIRHYECIERFKLKLTCVAKRDVLQIEFHFDAARLERADIERLADRFQRLLRSVINHPEVSVGDIDLLEEIERGRLLNEFNDTQADYSTDRCVHELFETQVERTPANIAAAFEEQRLTYYELNARANQLAHHLQTLGVRPETPVGLCVERSLKMVIGLLGILKAGGAYVPIDPQFPPQRRAFMLIDAGARVLVTQQGLDELPMGYDVHRVYLDSDWATIAQRDRRNPRREVTPANLMYVIYTSGSSGEPKGVMVDHRSVANYLAWMRDTYPLNAADRLLQTTSIGFDVSVRELFWPLLAGAQVVLLGASGAQDSSYLIDMLGRHKISQVRFVPSMLSAFLESEGLEVCQNLKRVFCGGEAMPAQLPPRFFALCGHADLHNTYGPTEATINATSWACRRDDQQAPIPLGRPLAFTQVFLLNEALQPVPVGAPGEVFIGGAGVARGYLNQPELTAERFLPHPFGRQGDRLYRSGDIARYRPDGNIEFLGRNDQQMHIRGYRIEPGEIEAVLGGHEAVRSAVVESLPDAAGERRLVAYVVAAKGHRPNVSELRAYLLQRLPEQMIPAAFVLLEALPLTPNGKIDRKALPAPDHNRPDLEKAFVAPRDELERQLAELWEEVLNVRPIGVRDNFFELGGHSLLALRVMAQVQRLFGKELALATLIHGGTIEHLAKLLRQENPSLSQKPLVAIKPEGTKPPFFAVHSVGGQVFCYVQLARLLGKDQPFYGLQAPSLNESEVQLTSIEEMAAHYVSAVREVQAEGPYYLGGYSFGGMVAFEIARQLRTEGLEVALVALLDSRSPRVFNLLPSYEENDAFMLTMLARVHAQERGRRIDISAAEFEGRDYEGQMAHFLQRLTEAELLPPDMTTASLATFLTGYKARQKAMRNYRPEIYPGRLVLYRAEEQDTWMLDNLEQAGVDINDGTMGWGQLSTEPVTVYEVPGNHDQICYKPHVKVLAKLLRIGIEQAPLPPKQLIEENVRKHAVGQGPLDWVKKVTSHKN